MFGIMPGDMLVSKLDSGVTWSLYSAYCKSSAESLDQVTSIKARIGSFTHKDTFLVVCIIKYEGKNDMLSTVLGGLCNGMFAWMYNIGICSFSVVQPVSS